LVLLRDSPREVFQEDEDRRGVDETLQGIQRNFCGFLRKWRVGGKEGCRVGEKKRGGGVKTYLQRGQRGKRKKAFSAISANEKC